MNDDLHVLVNCGLNFNVNKLLHCYENYHNILSCFRIPPRLCEPDSESEDLPTPPLRRNKKKRPFIAELDSEEEDQLSSLTIPTPLLRTRSTGKIKKKGFLNRMILFKVDFR